MNGTLFLVSTPIGNWDDITFRALKVLREVDVVVYEEHREGRRLLSHFNIPEKITETLNEHNEKESTIQIIRYLNEGKNVGLISDAGTPVFADPGQLLVKKTIEGNVTIVPIPGASSIVPALIISGFRIDEFLYYGFLSPNSSLRKKELQKLKDEDRTIIFMETPYRLVPLLKDISDVFGGDRRLCIPFNLTMNDEQIFRGTAYELFLKFSTHKIKGEFVVVVERDSKKRMKDEG
ncbi:MAG: 16S rRNA (cytidine(1402)-2'-O)-methyltransferase [Ignavibacteriales bacterium]|nr:16S rRNA (cytidine(1402)-2'-O)-methyltransferase [Ignavibacteriales bacterium]